MVKVEDLRVGNWVDYEHTSHYVTGIIDKSIYSKWPKQSTEEDDYVDMQDNYEPILLTPKILEAAGFRRDPQGGHNYFDVTLIGGRKTRIRGFLSEGVFCTIFKNERFVDVKHLHQLQNLFYSLTGEELKVQLPAKEPV
jgi:hypothetical protein